MTGYETRFAMLYSRLDPGDRHGERAEWRISSDVAIAIRRSFDLPDEARVDEQCFGIDVREVKDLPPDTIELWKRVQ